MASRKLEDLIPRFRDKAEQVLSLASEAGFDFLVTCTFRSEKEQAALYAQGRTKPGPRVTNAKPGESAHNVGFAVDIVPIIAGKPIWDAAHPLWQEYGRLVRLVGLEWAGDWTTFKEFPHMQMPNWRQILDGKNP